MKAGSPEYLHTVAAIEAATAQTAAAHALAEAQQIIATGEADYRATVVALLERIALAVEAKP